MWFPESRIEKVFRKDKTWINLKKEGNNPPNEGNIIGRESKKDEGCEAWNKQLTLKYLLCDTVMSV